MVQSSLADRWSASKERAVRVRHGRCRERGAGDLARAASTAAPAWSGWERAGESLRGRSGHEPGLKVALATGLAGQARAGQVRVESGVPVLLEHQMCAGLAHRRCGGVGAAPHEK